MIVLVLLAASALESYQRANALFQQQRFEEAETALNAALATDPALVPALTLKGKLAMGLNRFEVARQCFERAAAIEPKSPYVQFLLGFFYYVDNDFTKAIPVLENARTLKADDSRTHFYLALSYEGIGNVVQARKLYVRTVELETEQQKGVADTRVAYGRFLFAQGEIEAAQREIAVALRLAPQSRDAHYEQGRIHFERSEWAAAVQEGEKALALPGVGTTDRQIHYLLARGYAKTGNTELADRHLSAFKSSGVSLRR